MIEPNIKSTTVNSPQPDANQFLLYNFTTRNFKRFSPVPTASSHHYLHIYIGATHNLSFSPRIAMMHDRGNH